jgi:putative transposase
MNNRDYKNFAPGECYHIYNRGNNKEDVFLESNDYRAFLFRLGLVLGLEQKELLNNRLTQFPKSRIRINAKPNLFKLHAFCLMPNHFHLLIEQITEKPISKLMLQLCTSFSMYFNKKYKRVGHAFQDRFKSVLIKSNKQLMWVSSYIHGNPAKDGLVSNSKDYIWSSYSDFAYDRDLPLISKDLLIPIFGSKKAFIKETLNLQQKLPRGALDRLGD